MTTYREQRAEEKSKEKISSKGEDKFCLLENSLPLTREVQEQKNQTQPNQTPVCEHLKGHTVTESQNWSMKQSHLLPGPADRIK